jgi:hypothetical protein
MHLTTTAEISFSSASLSPITFHPHDLQGAIAIYRFHRNACDGSQKQ